MAMAWFRFMVKKKFLIKIKLIIFWTKLSNIRLKIIIKLNLTIKCI